MASKFAADHILIFFFYFRENKMAFHVNCLPSTLERDYGLTVTVFLKQTFFCLTTRSILKENITIVLKLGFKKRNKHMDT